MSEGRTKTRLHSPIAPPDAQNDDPATVAAHAAAGAAHAAVSGTQATPATPGALPVESELPLFPNIHVKGGARPAKLAVYKEKGGELAYLGVLTDVGATEERIRGMFGPGTYRLELRDESNRVLKGGQRHGVRIDPDPREEGEKKPDTETKTLVHVVDQVALERRLSEDRLKLLRQEQEDSIARRRAEADIEIKKMRTELELRDAAAEAKHARELSLLQERAKQDLERERMRYAADRERDQAQMQMFLSMQGKQTEVVIQAITAQKTDVGMMVGMLRDGMQLGAQTAQGNPEMAQMALMGKGVDAIAGALGGGGGGGPAGPVQQLEAGAKKELAGAGVEPTKAQRMIAKMKTVVGKAVAHGIDPEEALDAFIQQIEDYEAAGGEEGDEAPEKPAKGKTDAAPEKPAAPPAPAPGDKPRRGPAEPARSETRAVAQRAGGDGNGARAQRAGGGDRPRGTRR